MPMKTAGLSRFFSGLVTATAYLAFFVGNIEVAGSGYVRMAAAANLWTVNNNKIYLTKSLIFPKPTGAWGAVNQVKLMSAAAGGLVLAVWTGNEFSLVDPTGAVVAQIEEGVSVLIQGGLVNGLSITIPLA